MTVSGVGFLRTDAEEAAGVVPVNYHLPTGHVERYGAIGNGEANDVIAIRAAIRVARQRGGGRVVFRSATYFLGEYSKSARILDFADLTNIVFEGNGAQLACETTDKSSPVIFSFWNPSNLTFNALRFHDRGTRLDVDWQGAWAFWFETTGLSSHALGGIQINNCSGRSLVGFLRTTSEGSFKSRIRNVTLINCQVANSYYGINCRNNGDDLVAVNFRCENVRRAYFPYGVTNHNVDLSIFHDGVALGSNGCIEIGRYERDTSNLKIRAVFEGSGLNYGSYVSLQHGPNDDTGVIEDIDIDVHAARLSPNSGFILSLRSLRGAPGGAGVEETTTKNRFHRIRLAGNFGGAHSPDPISVRAKQEREGVLSLDPSVTETASQAMPHYPGFVVRVAHDREIRTLRGSLPAQTVVIPLSQLDAAAFALRVSVYAHDGALALQNCTYCEDVIVGYNAGGPAPVGINKVKRLNDVVVGAPAAITYTASGQDLTVGFGGSVYETPNAFARVEVQYVGRGPNF